MNYGGYTVFVGIEEHTHKENDFYYEMIKRDIIKINPNTGSTIGSKATLIYGQMNESLGTYAHVALTSLAIAKYFHNKEGQNVLLFINNIFCFIQTRLEVSALLGHIFSATEYQLILATYIGGL
jgi:F-type H+-transporting ATPase subunit beta